MATKKHSKASPVAKESVDVTIPIEKIAMRAYEKWCKRGCPHNPDQDQQDWFEAEAELRSELANQGALPRAGTRAASTSSAASLKEKRLQYLASLQEKLHDDDAFIRDTAIRGLFTLGARECVLLIISALDDSSAQIREEVRAAFFATYRDFPFSPKVRASLESNDSAIRRQAMREILSILPDAKEAIAARLPGWKDMLALTQTPIPEKTANPALALDKPQSSEGSAPVTEDLHMMKQSESSKVECDNRQKFLIRIPQKTDRVKAITAFRRVRATRVTLPGNVMGVNDEHIRVLERENIPFEYVSKAPNGKSTSI